MRGYTTIEQSNKLLSLGLDPSTADMCWKMANPDLPTLIAIPYDDTDKNIVVNALPAWSFTALLELMPDVHLKKYNYDGNTNYYITKVGIDTYTTDHYSCPIEAAIEMICWLIEQRYIKVNK